MAERTKATVLKTVDVGVPRLDNIAVVLGLTVVFPAARKELVRPARRSSKATGGALPRTIA